MTTNPQHDATDRANASEYVDAIAYATDRANASEYVDVLGDVDGGVRDGE
jgi:hypothetical protein